MFLSMVFYRITKKMEDTMKDSQRSKLYKVERIWERQFTKENGGGKA